VLLVNVRIVTPLRLMRRPWEVASVEPQPGNVWTLTIRPVGHGGIRFLPGQFAWIRVGRSPLGVRENPFSFASSAEHRPELSFGIKEAGDFTATLGSVTPGTRVYIDGPHGVFSYERNEGPAFVFVAGGIGISPMLSMLRTLADRGDRRPCVLLYGNPRWEEVPYVAELEELAGRLDLDVVHVIEQPPDDWAGEQGFIDEGVLDRHLPEHPERARYFLCGPPPMMESVEALLEQRGVPVHHIDFEQFDLI
jgi:predicted ferric reductase